MPMLEHAGASLYYEMHGEEGPWLTLVNGHTRSSRDFRLLAKTFVSEGFRCLTFDNRGSGQTRCANSFGLSDLTGDVYALWARCGISESHLVGISMGGMISQIVAAERPTQVRSLILISSSAHAHFLASLGFEPWGTDLASVEARLKRYISESYYRANKLLIQAMAKQVLAEIRNDDFEARAAAQHAAIEHLDNRPLLGRIASPTLIVHGSDDRVIDVEAARELAASIKGSELRIMEGRGHLLLAEDSKGLAQAILSFIRDR